MDEWASGRKWTRVDLVDQVDGKWRRLLARPSIPSTKSTLSTSVHGPLLACVQPGDAAKLQAAYAR